MDKTKQPYRYKAGDRVVLVYLRHRPQAEVLIDQPRSSLTVHVRDQDGVNRTPNANNIMLHEDWVKQEEARQVQEEALAGDTRKAMLDTFRTALTEYLQTNPIPAKGKLKKPAVQAAFDYALRMAGAVRYYDLGRGYVGRSRRAKLDGRPRPTPTNDEQTGLSLITIGGQAFRASYRKAARANQPVVTEGVIASVQAEPTPMQVEEEAKEVQDEVFILDRIDLVYSLVSRLLVNGQFAFIPNYGNLHHLIGLTIEEYEAFQTKLVDDGYGMWPFGFGSLVLPPSQRPTLEESIKTASLTELRAWFGLLLDEISERTQEKQEAVQ